MARFRFELTVMAALAALFVGASTRPACAQQEENRLLPGGAAYIGMGVSAIGTAELEDRLASQGYPTFGSTATAVNVGAYGILPGGVTLGAEWHGLIIGDGEHEGRDVGIGGGYGTIGLGYMVELSPRTRIYPRLGVGGGGMGLWMESDSASADFDDILIDPPEPAPLEREPVLSHFSGVVDVGMGAEFLPGGWGRGLMVGARLGYLAAPFNSNWQLYDRDVTGGPEASIAGPYIRVSVGVARR